MASGSDDKPYRDPLTLPYLAPARWMASAPYLPWPLRRAAARFHMRAARRRLHRIRGIAVNHSRCCSTSEPKGGLGPIWQYWSQGVDQAPPLVKACLRSVSRHRGERELIVLDDRSVADYVVLPGHVWDKRDLMGRQHFSNFVRLSLLSRHGGTWLDATILLGRPIPPEVEREPFYILRETTREPRWVETWFIHARQGHPLVETVLMGLADYWKTYDGLHDYFMFPFHLEASLLLHRRLRRSFLDMPQLDAKLPHELQWQLLQPFDEDRHRALYYRSWLHKLTHKYERPDVSGQLLCDAIVDGWAEGLPAEGSRVEHSGT